MSAQRPTIVPRSDWGGRGSRSGTIAPTQRRFYVVHYPVMGARDERQWMRDIEAMHIGQGWGMIGYSYGIGLSGTIYEGCGLTIRPIHSPPHNSDGWGIVHLQPSTAAGAITAPISDAMKRSSIALYDWLGSQAGRRLEKWWHGKDYATACPGPDLRAWVAAGMPPPAGAPTTPTPKPEEEEMAKTLVLYNADGRVEVHSIASGTPFHNFVQKDGKWSGWKKFGGGTLEEIEGARHPDGHLEVFGRRGSQTLHVWQRGPNGQWTTDYVPL